MKLFIVLRSFRESISLLRKDKKILFLSFIPILISFCLSTASSYFIMDKLKDFAMIQLQNHISSIFWSKFMVGLIFLVAGIFFFFIMNWLFMLIVSLISFPFTSLISKRVEENLEITTDIPSRSLSLFKGFLNEVKKIIFISFFVILALILSIIPFTAPLGIVLSALLMSIQFLDLNWSRHEMSFSECMGDIRTNFVSYFLSGMIFILFLSIPIFNILVVSYGASYYSVLWLRLQEHLRKK